MCDVKLTTARIGVLFGADVFSCRCVSLRENRYSPVITKVFGNKPPTIRPKKHNPDAERGGERFCGLAGSLLTLIRMDCIFLE